jgi:NAD(P)-dependent dehydrogenase (short-subunit alcohol dehydrogenase family)
VSKVAVSAVTFIQQRAFDADPREDLVVNTVHPGYVDTDMTSHKGPLTIEQGNQNNENMYAGPYRFIPCPKNMFKNLRGTRRIYSVYFV